MCGIAGLIYRDGARNIGGEMTAMLQALKHRGPDSTGFAVYGEPGPNEYIMRFKVAEQEDLGRGTKIRRAIAERKAAVDVGCWRSSALPSSIWTGRRTTRAATASPMTAT